MIELDWVQKRVRELTHEVNNPLSIVQNYWKTLGLKSALRAVDIRTSHPDQL
jgi:hypothetical protein